MVERSLDDIRDDNSKWIKKFQRDMRKLEKEKFADAKTGSSVLTTDQAVSGQSLWGYALLDPNPDDLVQAKGKGVKVYQDMIREPYVKTALMNKKMEVLAWPWAIRGGSESDEDVAIAAELQNNLENLDGQTFTETLFGILDALDCGYSITEKIFREPEEDKKYMYRKFKSLDTYYYKYGVDKFGNIKDIVAENVANMVEKRLPPEHYVCFSNSPRYSNPYGQSDLRAAYRAFWIKDSVWKFRAIYIERFGMPPLVGTTRPGTSKIVRDEMLAIIKQIQVQSNIVLPDEMKIEALNVATSNSSEYAKAIQDLNKEILVGIMGSFMSVEETRAGGARAQGEVHQDILKRWAQFVAKSLEDVADEQIVMPWVRLNYGDLENPPYFEFDRGEDFNEKESAEVLEKLVKMGFDVPKKWAHDRYNVPVPEDGEETLSIAAPMSPFGNPGPEDEEDEKEKASDDTRLIRLREDFNSRWEPLLVDIAAECFQAVKKSNVLADGDILKAKDMKLPVNVGRLKPALSDCMMYGNALGRGADVSITSNRDKMLLDAGMDSESFSEAIRRYDEDAFRLAGVLRNRLSKAFRHDLLACVAEGAGEDQVWAKFHANVLAQGLDNYRDAVDVEALSLGYNDGLKVGGV